ncbi:MAG TPA: sigma 54-interacting transcriptional regulator [Candidatus Binataceae bacterium]|nr:sigma 54-interacting transcriptional regulator [Candidatus Binataceae bacterium]
MEQSRHPGGEGRPRVTLGPAAPAGLADFIARAGLEIVPLSQRAQATLYVDFVGARPPGSEVLAIAVRERESAQVRHDADLVTESWPAAACLIISTALGLRPPLLTGDPEMLSTIKSAIGVAAAQIPVILCGELGVGKAHLARVIHLAGGARGPFVSADCARFESLALPPAGTIFLKELADLSDAAQLQLLRMLQGDGATAAGPAAPVRFIAATSRTPADLLAQGRLRPELYWRLSVFTLNVPPLRARAGDIALLARYLLRRTNARRSWSPLALKVLATHAFPGNLLELESLVTRLALAPLAGAGQIIDLPDLRQHLMIPTDEGCLSGWKSSREMARREMILRTIAAAGGNRAEAARRLGITVRALQYHITKAGLSRRRRLNHLPTAEAAASPAKAWEAL